MILLPKQAHQLFVPVLQVLHPPRGAEHRSAFLGENCAVWKDGLSFDLISLSVIFHLNAINSRAYWCDWSQDREGRHRSIPFTQVQWHMSPVQPACSLSTAFPWQPSPHLSTALQRKSKALPLEDPTVQHLCVCIYI